MAASILSFGMLTARAFWMVRRNIGLEAGSAPPAFTAMVMSLAMRANCFAMRFHRANIVCLRTSKMRPMGAWCTNGTAAASARAAGRARLACRTAVIASDQFAGVESDLFAGKSHAFCRRCDADERLACRKRRDRKRSIRRQESRLLPAGLMGMRGWPAG